MVSHAEAITAAAIGATATILVVSMLFGRVAQKLRQPVVVGEIFAGVLLGPSLLGLLPGNLTEHIFPTEIRSYLLTLAQFGLLPFMFMVGKNIELHSVREHKRSAIVISLASVTFSFAPGVLLATFLYKNHHIVNDKTVEFLPFSLFVGVAMSITAFPVLARILVDNRLINTHIGSLALASAAIDDIIAWCLLTLVAAISSADGLDSFVQILIATGIYIALMAAVIKPLFGKLLSEYARRDAASSVVLITCLAGLLFSAYATTKIGIHPIFGAFAFGVIMPRNTSVGMDKWATNRVSDLSAIMSKACEPLQQMSLVLLPIFFLVTGLGVNVGALNTRQLVELILILVVACAGKMIGSAIPARLSGLSWEDARAVGVLMNTRGLTELIVLSTGVYLGILDSSMFTMMVIMALLTTTMAGPYFSRFYKVTDAKLATQDRLDLSELHTTKAGPLKRQETRQEQSSSLSGL